MFMRAVVLIGIFASATFLRGDVITSYTLECTAGGVIQTVQGNGTSGGCSLSTGDFSPAIAQSNFSETLNTGGNSVSADLQGWILAGDGFSDVCTTPSGPCTVVYSSASAFLSVDMKVEVTVAGPVRQGIVKFLPDVFCGSTLGDGNGAAGASVTYSVNGTGGCGGASWEYIPVTMGGGEILTFEETGSGAGYGAPNQDDGNAIIGDGFQAEVFEADGVTAVNLISSPEPSTIFATAIGLLLLLSASTLRRYISRFSRRS